MDFEVHWGVEDSEREPVANLLYDSLGEKFIPVLGTRTKGVLCVANALVSERTIVAKANHKVLGIAGLEFEKLGFLNMSLRYLLKCLGRGILRAIFNGWILEQDNSLIPSRKLLLIETSPR